MWDDYIYGKVTSFSVRPFLKLSGRVSVSSRSVIVIFFSSNVTFLNTGSNLQASNDFINYNNIIIIFFYLIKTI